MYNTEQCNKERENKKAQEGKKVGGAAEIETDPDCLEMKLHPGWLEHASSGQI